MILATKMLNMWNLEKLKPNLTIIIKTTSKKSAWNMKPLPKKMKFSQISTLTKAKPIPNKILLPTTIEDMPVGEALVKTLLLMSTVAGTMAFGGTHTGAMAGTDGIDGTHGIHGIGIWVGAIMVLLTLGILPILVLAGITLEILFGMDTMVIPIGIMDLDTTIITEQV